MSELLRSASGLRSYQLTKWSSCGMSLSNLGGKTPDNVMKNDMLCHMTEGELSVVQNEKKFTVKKGDVWTCANADTTEGTQNTSSAVAIMRVIDLMTT